MFYPDALRVRALEIAQITHGSCSDAPSVVKAARLYLEFLANDQETPRKPASKRKR